MQTQVMEKTKMHERDRKKAILWGHSAGYSIIAKKKKNAPLDTVLFVEVTKKKKNDCGSEMRDSNPQCTVLQ